MRASRVQYTGPTVLVRVKITVRDRVSLCLREIMVTADLTGTGDRSVNEKR